jgi:hypothetical protein
MNTKHFAVKIAAVVALIFTVAGISVRSTSAKAMTQEANGASSLRFDTLHRYIGPVDDPVATYEGARIVHNVTVDGEKGMRVHANFRVRYGLGVACMMIAYFYYDDEDNTPLKTDDPKFRAKNGVVSTTVNFTPAYDPAVYEDLQLFMPYDGLNMEGGQKYNLKFYLALYDKEGGRFFGKSGWYKFVLTMP